MFFIRLKRLIKKYYSIMLNNLMKYLIMLFTFTCTTSLRDRYGNYYQKPKRGPDKTTEPIGLDFVEKYASILGTTYDHFVKYLTSVPTFTTVRVNLKNYTPQQVVAILKKKLTEKYGEAPDIFVHDQLYDCVVVGPLPKLSETVIDHPHHVIVDMPCGLSILRGANVFAPGVLSMPTGLKVGTKVSIYADLAKKCLRGQTGDYEHAKCLIACGILKMNRHTLFANNTQTKGIAIEVTNVVSQVPNFQIDSSLGILQNLPSIVAGHYLEPKPGHKILDMCAAPGHKTTHIAIQMNDTGTIIALDKSKLRVKKLEETIEKLGLSCIQPYVYDSTKINSSSSSIDDIKKMELEENSFDRILLDAPCSGFGQRPMFYNQLPNLNLDKNIKSFANIQKKLVNAAIPLLKENGILVYCTCSLSVEENEAIIAWLLKNYPEMEAIQTIPKLGALPLSHIGLKSADRALLQRFGPPLVPSNYNLNTIGFFIAKLRKKYHIPSTAKPKTRRKTDFF